MSPARARLLEHVVEHGEVSVDEVAEAFGQHPNTVREHLDALVGGGLLMRERTPGPGRGRPAWRYRVNPQQREPDPQLREYRALVSALAEHIAARSPDPRAEARAAGTRWGRTLIGPVHDALEAGPAAASLDTGAAHQRVVRLLADLDFSPRPERAGRVTLTTCPILDVARAHPEVVCAVHEGMIVGALETLGAPSDGVALRPFAAPEGCLLTLSGDAQPEPPVR